ncbi:MAG: 3-oxoacyl-[acyl-carrier-protein] reductase [Haliangiales bacterium]
MRRALIFGGTGAVGSALVHALSDRGAKVRFTWNQRRPAAEAEAEALIAAVTAAQAQTQENPTATGNTPRQRALPTALGVDLSDLAATRAVLRKLIDADEAPDIIVHCAAVADVEPWHTLSDDAWERSQRIGCQALFAAVQELAPSLRARGGGDVIAVGGLDRAQSLPIPVLYAATQGMLSGLVMALAKQLGGDNVRVNMVALGPLETGLSHKLDPELRAAYLRFSAQRRLGTAEEAAHAIAWLALNNRYMNGKVLPVNGGI